MAKTPPEQYCEALAATLECPICRNTVRPPLYLCENGHTFCPECTYRIGRKCAECRGNMTRNRCKLLEKLYNLTFLPCRYADQGCTYITKGEFLQQHEWHCDYEVKHCSVPDCHWYGPKNMLSRHYVDSHNE